MTTTTATATLTTRHAAEYLGVACVTLTVWRSQGRGPRYLRLGRLVRYRISDLDEWLQEQIIEPAKDQ